MNWWRGRWSSHATTLRSSDTWPSTSANGYDTKTSPDYHKFLICLVCFPHWTENISNNCLFQNRLDEAIKLLPSNCCRTCLRWTPLQPSSTTSWLSATSTRRSSLRKLSHEEEMLLRLHGVLVMKQLVVCFCFSDQSLWRSHIFISDRLLSSLPEIKRLRSLCIHHLEKTVQLKSGFKHAKAELALQYAEMSDKERCSWTHLFHPTGQPKDHSVDEGSHSSREDVLKLNRGISLQMPWFRSPKQKHNLNLTERRQRTKQDPSKPEPGKTNLIFGILNTFHSVA